MEVIPSHEITSDSSQSYESTNLGPFLKHSKLRKTNYYKLFQRDMIHLTGYISSITPNLKIVHNVMSFLRILQFLLPCLIPSYTNFWSQGSVEQVTINVISVLFSLVPPASISSAINYILITYIIFQSLFIILFCFSSYYFKKRAKLPKYAPIILYLYQITLGYYFVPIVVYTISEGISYMATNDIPSSTSFSQLIILDFFSLICLAFNVLLIFIDISECLEYRPISLNSTTPVPHFLIFVMTIMINSFFGIAVNLQKKQQIVFFCFIIFFYVLTSFSVFIGGGFIQTYVTNIVLTSSITGACFTLLNLLFLVVDRRGTLIIFFSFIIFFVMILILVYFIFQSLTVKQLKILDSIQADESMFSFVRKPNQFVFIASMGIKYAHPIILDLTFFNLGIQRWTKDQFVFLIYAKFVAIYPEETPTLKYVYKNISRHKYNSFAIRCIEEQAKSIMKHRETEMTPQLHSRLNQLKRQNQSTKHKLEHVWDVVILGNINEIDLAAKGALNSINETDADFKRLLVEYPNNRNVTHFYSAFLNEIIGDHSLSQEFHERTKALKTGTFLISDKTQLHGLDAFPNLPNSIRSQKDPLILVEDNHSETNNSYYKDKERQNNLDLIAGIKNNIDELKIPSITGTKLIRIFVSLLFIVPSIAGLIYIGFYINHIKKPLDFISSLSLLRTYSFHIVAFSIRYLGECLSVFPKPSEKVASRPYAFGGTWDTKKQLEFILNTTSNELRDFDKYRNFEEKNFYIQKAHLVAFQNSVEYVYYASPTNVTRSNISLQASIIDFTIQLKSILMANSINPTILNTGLVLNLINNIMSIANNIHLAIQHVFDFLKSDFNNTKKLELLLFIVLILVVILVFIISTAIQIKWINSNKKETYQCLFSLPKNVVSKLAENRNLNKKENQPEDMNKQNDNIIRTFNSYGSADNSFSDVFLLIFGTFFIFVFSIICIFMFMNLFISLVKTVIASGPYLHYALASYSMILSSFNWMNVIMLDLAGYQIPTTSFNTSLVRLRSTLNWSSYYYHILMKGSEYTNEVPLKELTRAIALASPKNCSIVGLMDKVSQLLNERNSSINSELLDCLSIDMLIILFEPIIWYSVMPCQNRTYSNFIDSKKDEFNEFWRLLISPIYDQFFDPLHFHIIPSITKDLVAQKNQVITVIVLLIVATFVIEFILYIQILIIENHIKSVLKLLLHCSPSVIYSSNKITRILSGDFSGKLNESLVHNDTFFDTIFSNLPDAIMYTNSDMIIQNANNQCKRVFGDIKLIGKNIVEFFMSDRFSGNTESLFSLVNSNPIEEIEYKLDVNTDIFLKVTSMIANSRFVMICQDVTQAHNYNTLILTEKQNSDKLLETILPPSLVGRVQQGEKNISLSVQSASILFSDIVSFTPWCGSLPAEKVMATLNILFKRMDSILDTKPTMTKIKCIGDCYMAAGGIFAELNQPVIHAREVVSFGLMSIKEVVKINKEIQENLRIRVGVNTGGPIVAGVLGIGKPTFEIIGPAINRAQQMEQNGIPMKVHISLPVYDLICGLNFKFSTRRTIQCKNENVVTYIVEP